ncbi:response regulator [Virgibacillus indicus]|uniref:Response regulator n=1 Tax=Virgibacillus indicus TaxID=2024554 RepID=A0A265NAG6_9BACI|nr:response regulator [Virgibacillus indicus]OZU88464.1 response regulator [Virgibacillus indicus]
MAKKILVVDDQPGIRMLLTDILENEGYSVSTANTGKQGLEEINSRSYDLVILDYKLPVIDGSQVLKEIETGGIVLPAILISGLAEDITKEAENYSFVKNVLAKPFNVEDISKTVKSILEAPG